MTKIYTPNTWTDEVLAAAEVYEVIDSDSAVLFSDVAINITTPIAVAGTSITAALMNNIEDGLDGLDTKVSGMEGDITDIQTALPVGAIVGTTDTQTLTNKRIDPRVGSTTSHATPTINTNNFDAYSITALAEAITSFTTNLSGTPVNFQKLIIRIKDNGTARAITWGASFEACGVALPVTTVISKRMMVGLIYDTVSAKWGCVAVAQEA